MCSYWVVVHTDSINIVYFDTHISYIDQFDLIRSFYNKSQISKRSIQHTQHLYTSTATPRSSIASMISSLTVCAPSFPSSSLLSIATS